MILRLASILIFIIGVYNDAEACVVGKFPAETHEPLNGWIAYIRIPNYTHDVKPITLGEAIEKIIQVIHRIGAFDRECHRFASLESCAVGFIEDRASIIDGGVHWQ